MRLTVQNNDVPDLNAVWVEHHQVDNVDTGVETATSTDGSVKVYFRELEKHLLRHIQKADAVLGCVAWLTNSRILAALAKVKSVAIVVQKEDFLRPDLKSGQNWPRKLRSMYDRLHCGLDRYEFPRLINQLSVAGDPTLQPIRCVGNYNRDKNPAFPRMHHKFIIFCRYQYKTEQDPYDKQTRTSTTIEPYAVWTGSFNFTENAVRSLENALVFTDPQIVWAYYDEWARVETISEELDWTSDWAAPEWRIGT